MKNSKSKMQNAKSKIKMQYQKFKEIIHKVQNTMFESQEDNVNVNQKCNNVLSNAIKNKCSKCKLNLEINQWIIK